MKGNANSLIYKGGTGAASTAHLAFVGVCNGELRNPLIYKGGTGAAWRGPIL